MFGLQEGGARVPAQEGGERVSGRTHTAHPCGTMAAYRRHRRNNEQPCEACRFANSVYLRDYRRKRKQGAAVRTPKPCGTIAAYRRHLYKGEPPCEACRTASRERSRNTRFTEIYEPLAERIFDDLHCPPGAPCGTAEGFVGHVLQEHQPCRDCINAARLYLRRLDMVHGTQAGYARHRRNGERPCEDCTRAHNEDAKERKQRKKRGEP